MKKNKLILCMGALLSISLIASGCGKEIEVKNGSKVAVSTKGYKYTATEYYNEIKKDNISKLVEMIDTDMLSKKYPKTSEEDDDVNKQINQIKSYYGDDDTSFKKIIKQYFGVETEKELEEKLRLEYKRNEAVKDYVLKNVKDDEVKKYYEEKIFGEVKASHILIKVDAASDASEDDKQKAEDKAKETAEKVIKELEKGTKFSKLAKKYSDDQGTASNGGDLGYFSLDEMTEAFANAVKELKKDEYTKEPVKTEYGYHIILKTGEKEKPKLKKVKKDIKEKIRDNKLDESKSLYYEALRDIRIENKIKWNDDSLKSAYDEYVQELIDSANSSNS